ncbi:MAG: AMP-binding protein [Oscillospiraceae bacterium]|nr:AMP-binding protein [Oscillospiraceae bacterium]
MKRSRIDDLIRRQENLPEVTRAEIEAVQLDKLNRLLAREKERGGFYRGLPAHLDSLSQLSGLPFTTDEDLAHHAPGLLLTSQGDIQRVLSDATSGTTGAAKRVFYTERDCENTVQLFAAGLGELIVPGSVTLLCFPFSGPYGLGELISEAIERLGARPLKTGPFLSYGEYAEILEREKPDTYVGMPVPLLSLLRVCGRGSLRRALVSGDACPDTVLNACEELLGSRLFPHYGSREMGLGGAITCPAHAGMHLRENHVIAEIIDGAGNILHDGEVGELVITTIGMEAMPLIRYRTGDYTRILSDPCPCGSKVIRLDRLQRRETQTIADLDETLFSLEGLVDYRAVQKGNVLSLEALTTGDFPAETIRQKAVACFPDRIITITCRPVSPGDTTLCRGKRSIVIAE